MRSAGPQGTAISMPATFQNIPIGLSLCCDAPPCSSPWLMWKVAGTDTLPPDPWRAVETSLAIVENAG